MHPVLFHIPMKWFDSLVGTSLGYVPIYSYGVMLGLSIVAGWYLAMFLARKEDVPPRDLSNGIFTTVLLALIGARLLYIVTNLDRFGRFIDYFSVRDGGLVAYGGFLGGALGAWLWSRHKKLNFLKVADIMSPPVALGLAFTRIGCFLYGCDFGVPTSLPWGIRFPKNSYYDRATDTWKPSPAFEQHVREGISHNGEVVLSTSEWSLPVHPTQLYEVINGLVIFAVLLLILKRKKFDGQIFLIFAGYYGVTRFLLEIIRGDEQRGAVSILSTSQIIGIATLGLAIWGWFMLRNRGIGPGVLAASTADGASKGFTKAVESKAATKTKAAAKPKAAAESKETAKPGAAAEPKAAAKPKVSTKSKTAGRTGKKKRSRKKGRR